MRIGIFSDIHGHVFREFSYITPDGINSRLVNQKEWLEDFKQTVLDKNIQCLLFGGDMTHLKNNVDSQVIKVIGEAIKNLSCAVPIFAIPGNHDYRMWGSEPALLEVFESNGESIHVMGQGWKNIHLEDEVVRFYFAPYRRDIKILNEEIENLEVATENAQLGTQGRVPAEHYEDAYFLGHQDTMGVTYGGHKVEKGLDPDILLKKFKYSFIGHWHTSKKIRDNVISIGSPFQLNFSDEGTEHGWWILDTKSGEVEFIKTEGLPEFHTLHYGKDFATEFVGNKQNDFYRVILDGIEEPKETTDIVHKRVMKRPGGESSKRTSMSVVDSAKDIIEKYVEWCGSGFDPKKLVGIGRNYL